MVQNSQVTLDHDQLVKLVDNYRDRNQIGNVDQKWCSEPGSTVYMYEEVSCIRGKCISVVTLVQGGAVVTDDVNELGARALFTRAGTPIDSLFCTSDEITTMHLNLISNCPLYE